MKSRTNEQGNVSLYRGLLVGVLLALVFNSGGSLGANAIAEGDQWLKWGGETRLEYVSAYLRGNARGFRDGCEAGQEAYSGGNLAGLPGEKCLPKLPKYSNNMEEYVRTITDYYRSYPTDRFVPIFKVLEGLSDSRKLTIQRMHDYYGPKLKGS